MIKTQLIAALAEDTGSARKIAAAILDSLSNIVKREVAAGSEVIIEAADRAVKATIAKALKDAVNS